MLVRVNRRVLPVLAALTALLLLPGLLIIAPAGAATPAPSGLSASAVGGSRTPVLSWKRVATATSYEVELSSDPSFSRRLESTRTTNNRYVPTSHLPTGTFSWRVRAIGADRTRSGWSSRTSSVAAVGAPRQVGPANGARLQQPTEPPLLEWTEVQGASRYVIEVDTDADFINAKSYNTSATSYVVADTLEPRHYYWRVRAELDKGIVSQWTAARTFELLPLPAVEVTPPQDADRRLGSEDVHLDWKPVLGAKEYELEVSTDPSFNNTSATVEKIKVKGTRYSPPETYLNNQYYWRVRALNAQGHPGPWRDNPPVFQRAWPARPQLVHPADSLEVVGDDFYYEWTPVDHATRYQLDVGTDPNFSPGTFETCYTASTIYTAGYYRDDCMPAEGAVTHWRVRALDDPKGVQGIFSPTQRFIYASEAVPMVSPAAGATVDVPTLRWKALRDTERYEVEVKQDGRSIQKATTYALSWTPSKKLDPAKPVTWSVRAIDVDGSSGPWYGERTFFLSGSPGTTGAAPLTPLTGTGSDAPTTRFPMLSWEPHPEAAYYRVSIGVSGSGFDFASSYAAILKTEHLFPAATDTGTQLMGVGSYDWHVTAYGAKDQVLASGPRATFTIEDLPAVSGHRIALRGSDLDAVGTPDCAIALGATGRGAANEAQCEDVPVTPVLDWDPVPGASHYIVYLAEDRELTNLVYKSPTARTAAGTLTSNTRWTPRWNHTPKALPDSVAGTAYYWVIRPCRTLDLCAPDPVSVDASAEHAFEKHSPSVRLLGPDGPAANDIRFDWEDYLLTNEQTRWSGHPADPAHPTASSHQAAKQYRIQVSTSPEFTQRALVENRLVDQTTFTPFSKLYPEGTLFWRVQAVDANNNGLVWSEVRSFKKASPEPRIQGPASNSTVSGPPPQLRWHATQFAASYEVEVYRNARSDTAFSPANRVLRATTLQPALVPDKALPPSKEPYTWRVRRIDASGNPGQWNPRSDGDSADPRSRTLFQVNGAAPRLVSPAHGSKPAANGALLRWTAVPGAVSYRVEQTSSSRTQTTTTRALAYAPTSSLPHGTTSWRVTAIGADGNVLGTSASRTLTVDATAPTARLVRPKGSAKKRKPVIVIRFSEPVVGVKRKTVTLSPYGKKKSIRVKMNLNRKKRVLKIVPRKRLKRRTSYRVELRPGIRDRAGNPARTASWTVRVR